MHNAPCAANKIDEASTEIAATQRPDTPRRHLPGELGIWIFIVGDMMVFGLFFVTFTVYRSFDVDLYTKAHAAMSEGFGLINTLLLLTSSWFVALGVRAARLGETQRAPRHLTFAILCGVGFCVVKFFEYGEKIGAGLTLNTNEFLMFYYMFTATHLLHVVIGIGVLAFMWSLVRKPRLEPADIMSIESGASFWHLVDILWIVLFTLFYLMK